jgi:uncharacterized protein YukE
MSKRGATPGPWTYQENSDVYTHIVRGAGNAFVCQFAQDTTGRAEADARITAASWDLLAALREAEEEIVETRRSITEARKHNWEGIAHPKFEETYQREMARYDRLLERIRAAIAKAIGPATSERTPACPGPRGPDPAGRDRPDFGRRG